MKPRAAEPRQAGSVNTKSRPLLLGAVGLAAILIAWSVRANILARRHAPNDAAAKQRSLLQQRALQIAALRRQVEINPGNIQAHRELATLYVRYNMADQAVGELEALARLQPNDQSAQLTLASAYGALKRWPQAVSYYLLTIKNWPDSAAGWQGLSVTLYSLKQYQRAMWAAQHAFRLQPDDIRNRFGMAAATLEWAIQTDRTGSRIPQIESAQQQLTQLLPKWPDRAGIEFLLGRAYAALDKVDLAIEHMGAANRLQPELPEIAFGLGRLCLRQQRRVEGRAIVERALASNPQNPDLIDLLGQLWDGSGEPGADPQALTQFEMAAKLVPTNPLFQERLGSALLRANQIDHARIAFETAIRIDPNRSFPYQQLAVVYTRLRDKTRATKIAEAAKEVEFNAEQLKHLQALVATHPENLPLHLQLADRYRDLGIKNLAEDEYLEATRLDPHNAHANSALKALTSRPPSLQERGSSPAPPSPGAGTKRVGHES